MKRSGTRRDSPGLPPREFWLLNKFERIPTPQDDLKRVDVAKLIPAVKTTLNPSYNAWDLSQINSHHLFFPGKEFVKRYPRKHRDLATDFRSLHINQIKLPILFHNYLHAVTEIPEVPTPEVMEYTVNSAGVLERFFQNLNLATQWERVARRQELIRQGVIQPENDEKILDPAQIQTILSENDEKLFTSFESFYKLPPEFRPVDPDKPMTRIVKEAGRLAAPEGLTYIRAVALPLAA